MSKRPSPAGHFSKSFPVVSLFFLAVMSVVGLAQSRLNFPRIDLAPETFTGIAIVNPNATQADVQLTLYQPDGTLLDEDGIQNPVDISVGAESQFADLVSAIFGNSSDLLPGTWLQASSSSDNLTGFFLFLNPAVTFFDGADLPPLSTELVFDSVREDETYSTEINLINPNAAAAQVTFRKVQVGSEVSRTLEIPAFGSLRSAYGDLFEGAAASGAASQPSYLKVNSNQEIGGFYFVRGAGDLLGLNAHPAADVLNTLYFPQMTVLDLFLTELVVVSLSPKSELVTVTAYQPDGSLFGNEDLQTNPVTLLLEPGEGIRESLETLFGFAGNTTLQGWLKVEATTSAIQGSLSYLITASGSLAAVASQSRGRTRAVFSHIATTAGFFTGVALLNPGALAANARVVALKPDGSLLGTYGAVLQPRQRISMLINQMIPAANNQAGGLIFVRSDLPIFLTSLFGGATGVLANIPPQPVPASFQPDSQEPNLRLNPPLAVLTPGSQQQFAISGLAGAPSWTVNGVDGGSAASGMIDAQGVFHAPQQPPAELPLIIGARLEGQMVGASVDVLSPQAIVLNRGEIQSLAYVASLQKLFTAELALSGASQGSLGPLGGVTTNIFDVTSDPLAVVGLAGEDIAKMVPFEGINQRAYLLLASRSTGKIIRLELQSAVPEVVATGLESPSAIALDPLTGDLLVAEANQVSTVSSADLNKFLQPAAFPLPGKTRQGINFGSVAPAGIGVDPCSGDIYVSDRTQAAVVVYPRDSLTPQVVAGGLETPGQLLALNRSGVSCPTSFHLLVIEEGVDLVRLLVPSQGINTVWANAAGVRDLTFVPPDSPLAAEGGVLLGEFPGSAGGRVESVPVANLYQPQVPNPAISLPDPPENVTGFGTVSASTTSPGFPAELSVDGDRTTSWFSAGSNGESRNFSLYAWGVDQEILISKIAVLSNRDHPLFAQNFGFDSITIRVYDGIPPLQSGPLALRFEQTISLAGTPDPDVVVFPEVFGNIVELTLTGHEFPDCGGFAELQVFARGAVFPQTVQ